MQPTPIELADHRSDAVAKPEPPTTQTEIRSSVCLCNMFQRLVSYFTCLDLFSKKTLTKHQPKNFDTLDEKEGAAVALLNDSLIAPQVPALPKRKN